jgi:hypothetical protein
MSRQNEDETSRPAQNKKQTSRRKFLTGSGFVGAATVTPAAAKAVPQSEWSPEQISKLEEIVRDFVTNAEGANIQPLGSTLALAGHGSHNNAGGASPRPAVENRADQDDADEPVAEEVISFTRTGGRSYTRT